MTEVTVVETVWLLPSLLSVSVDVQADGGDRWRRLAEVAELAVCIRGCRLTGAADGGSC